MQPMQPMQPVPPMQPMPGWAPQQDFKPGIVPLRPLSVGEILDGGFATIRRHPRIVFGFAALFAVLVQLGRLLTGALMDDVRGSLGSFVKTTTAPDGFTTQTQISGAGLASTVVEQVLSGLFGALLAGIVTVVVGRAILGHSITGAQVVDALRGRKWRLILASLVAGLGPWAPAFVVAVLAIFAALAGDAALAVTLIIGIPVALALGLFLWGKLALVVPAFVLERIGASQAVGRSWRLVRGAFWRTWGLRALVTLLVGVAASVITVPTIALSFVVGGSLEGGQQPLPALAVVAIGGMIGWMVTQPLLAAALTLIYVDRRNRSEGLDIQLAQAARASAASKL